MRWRSATSVPALAVVLGAFSSVPALAASGVCPPMAVEADAGVNERWPELAARVRAAFVTRDDIDACAQVALTTIDASISVLVTLPDGRTASRAVSRPEDVVPTLEALLIVPPPEAHAPPPPEPQSTPIPAHDMPADLERSAPIASGPDQPSRLRIELSVASTARVGDSVTSLGLGALAFLDISQWLVGFEGRADRYEYADGTPSGGALELAVLAGRRLPFGSFALDLIAGPALAIGGESSVTIARSANSSASAGAGGMESIVRESGTGRAAMPRLLLKAHLSFGARSVVRGFVGVNGELGPADDLPADSRGDDAQRLPAWTVGVALGATVGTTS
jgi:hypothetical protein